MKKQEGSVRAGIDNRTGRRKGGPKVLGEPEIAVMHFHSRRAGQKIRTGQNCKGPPLEQDPTPDVAS